MNLSKLRTLSIVFFLIINLLVGRVQSQSVFKVEDNLMIGDKSSLFELIKYFDSSRQIVELSCAGKVPLYGIAKRIFSENCAFTEEEIDNLEYYEDYLEFLNKNYDRITFFEEAKVFLITPLNERAIKYEIKRLPNERLKWLKDSTSKLFKPDWIHQHKIDSLVNDRNPLALLKIASEFYRQRTRGPNLQMNEDEFIDLIEFLTGNEFGLENDYGVIGWSSKSKFTSEGYLGVELNLLIYFSKYYTSYFWDDNQNIFVRKN